MRIRDEVSKIGESHIFIQNYPIPSRALDNNVMSGSDINVNMQRLSPDLPIHMTYNLLQLIVTMLLEHFSPMMLPKKKKEDWSVDESVVACQSVLEQCQHGSLVGGVHYVESLNVPLALEMTLKKARHHMMVSQMVQSLVGMNPMGEGLDEEMLPTSPVYRWKRNEQKATYRGGCFWCI